MEYYFSYETLSNGESRGKGTTVFEAKDLRDAFVKGIEMFVVQPGGLSPDIEERITVGNVVHFLDPAV